MEPITITDSAPQQVTVAAGKHYLLRAQGADVTIQEELDGAYEDLSENGTLAAGETRDYAFNSGRVLLSVASGAASVYLSINTVRS